MLDIALGYEHIAQRAERRVNAHEFGKKRRPVDDGANGLEHRAFNRKHSRRA